MPAGAQKLKLPKFYIISEDGSVSKTDDPEMAEELAEADNTVIDLTTGRLFNSTDEIGEAI